MSARLSCKSVRTRPGLLGPSSCSTLSSPPNSPMRRLMTPQGSKIPPPPPPGTYFASPLLLMRSRKGVADEELAKKEAERARKRELEDGNEPAYKRQRSSSVDSVSSISTRSSRSPPPRRQPSPSPRRARAERRSVPSRSRSFDSASDQGPRRSLSPETRYRSRDGGRRSSNRRSPSPALGSEARDHRRHRSPSPLDEPPFRRARSEESVLSDQFPPNQNDHSRESRDKGRPRPQRRFKSRSPGRSEPRNTRPNQGDYGRYRDRSRSQDREEAVRGQAHQRVPPRQPEPPRERSLSPFSKRLALTQAMNMGR